jgi:ubiquinone/menaquinone biosynthesis C-methylase UbiE
MAVDPLAARAFDAAAEDYERGRPGWPADAVAALLDRFGARREGTVLDLAAGTGKLTRTLAELTAGVVAVEPLDEMRRVLQTRLPAVRTLAGTAEAIPLADGSVAAAFVAEAFHWFDLPRATAELARVLRPGGGLALMWNTSDDEGVDWIDELHAVVLEHHLKEAGANRRETVPWREALAADGRFEALRDEEATHEQRTDRDALVAMIASFSSIGGLPDDRRTAALAECRAVLERHDVDAVTLNYRALITTTRRIDG